MIYETTIIGKRRVASRTLEISVGLPKRLKYQPGQYMQVAVPKLAHSDFKGRSRVMSMISSPSERDILTFAFRETGSGYKRTLAELPLGSSVKLEGPHGYFTLPEQPRRPIVCVAGGIGVTPYVSMIRTVVLRSIPVDFTLLYANRSRESTAYREELAQTASMAINVTVQHIEGPIEQHHISEVGRAVGGAHRCIWNVAGPPAMVDSVRNFLFLTRVKPFMVCSEEFAGY